MALKKVKGNFERMFDKNLTDLVRGIRNNKDNEAKYISTCIEEIKQELRQDNISVKCNAVAKLTYIQMLGYDISWAGFNIIEVMSSSRFTCKRIGYLAASQCFHPDSELLMLTTNMIRKDLNSQNQYDAGVALSGLSCFISPDLSRDLANDIMTLMSSTKPYLRMKAVLMMYKVFLRYPEALRPAFPKLKEKLEDPDPGVQSAAVNVICELARKNPKNYLPLAPIFFKLMTTSTNNWMLIKIIKLFGALTPLEPRLGKKLIEPLTNLIHSTSAMSLLYECINTVIAVLISISSGMPNHSASIQLCVQKLRILIEDSDQNLKYLGLLAMSKILKTHPKSVQAHKDLILACLDDKDESIRLRALDLLYGMVSKKNLMEIVKRLLGHMERAEGSAYRDELLYKVIEICGQSSYLYVTNFEWYLTVLVELIQLEAGSRHGRLIAEQLLDVAIRVPVVRQFAVNEMTNLLDTFTVSAQSNSMYEVLYAAAWIVGEFAGELEDAERTLNILLRPRQLPGHIQGVYVQNVIKLFARLATTCLELQDLPGIVRLCDHVLDKLQHFNGSSDIEVQERASSACMLIEMLRTQLTATDESAMVMETAESGIPPLAIEIVQEMTLLFAGELIPVAPKAQRKVPLPDGLDLDEWINAPPPEDNPSSSSSEHDKEELFVSAAQAGGGTAMGHDGGHGGAGKRRKSLELTPEQMERQRLARLIEQSNNPHYLKSTNASASAAGASNADQYDNIDDIPITELPLDMDGVAALRVGVTKRSDKYLQDQQAAAALQGGGAGKDGKKKHKKSKKSKKAKNKVAYNSSSESEGEPKPLHIVNTTLDMPEGVSLSDSEDKDGKYDPNDPHRALDIELDIADFEAPAASRSASKKSKEGKENLKVPAEPATNSTSKKEKKKDKDKTREHKRERKAHTQPVVVDLIDADTPTPSPRHAPPATTTANANNSLNTSSTVLPDATTEEHHKQHKKKRNKEKNKEAAASVAEEATAASGSIIDVEDDASTLVASKTHKKKHKKEKSRRKEKKEESESATASVSAADYEQPLGISTPSKEIF
ncbi:AP-3 complex subunit delta isoform X1 [Drosophila persimilis]|uniref:AP-3 complex subunit delta isoform X1 n=1 Tax=Drosophila persimilis TaxID=7234 RepID=UPI000F0845D1|nr:AP-3 complex subunit delta isoform X1 [Drosophila persimilis]XP_026848640.1 AP-3 complex subunit delta isoform X1 [Drosophila persimilis]